MSSETLQGWSQSDIYQWDCEQRQVHFPLLFCAFSEEEI